MKIIKNDSKLIVVLDSGAVIQGNCDEELFQKVVNATSDEEVMSLLPVVYSTIEKLDKAERIFNEVMTSKYLSRHNNSIYWREISELSLPEDLVLAILKAEKEDNEDALTAYRNFWTLMSLNPDNRCRQNLFWFLNKFGMKISKSGLFIGYRNVDIYQYGTQYFYSQEFCDYIKEIYEHKRALKHGTSHFYVFKDYDGYFGVIDDRTKLYTEYPNKDTLINLKTAYDELKAVNFIAKNCGGDTIYTDCYSHTFRIKIGKLVTMHRDKVDSVQEHQCSSGLHLANAEWLNQNYFGSQGLVCLCNPAKVCAVPYDASYGKLRTCEYLPIALIEYDENGKVIPYNVDDGFESKWVQKVLYSGDVNTEDMSTYQIEVPETPEINRSVISQAVYNIAKEFINNKN